MLPDGRKTTPAAHCVDVAIEDRYTRSTGTGAIVKTTVKSIFLSRIGGLCEEVPRGIELGDDVSEEATRLSSAHCIDEWRAALDCGCSTGKHFNPGVGKEVRQPQPNSAASRGAIRAIRCELRKNALNFLAAHIVSSQRVIPTVRIDALIRRGDAEKVGAETIRPGPNGGRARGQRILQDQSRITRTLSFRLNIARDIERTATDRNRGAPLIACATVKRAARKRWRLGQCRRKGFIRRELIVVDHIPAECVEDAVCDCNAGVSRSWHWGFGGPRVCCWIISFIYSRAETSDEVELTVDDANTGRTGGRHGGSFSGPRICYRIVGIDRAI